MAFLTNDQIKQLGLKSFGENVLISDKAFILLNRKTQSTHKISQ